MSKDKISVGLFGIGLDTYWPQFEGLKERLEGYQEDIAREILKNDAVNLVNVGLVDNPKRAATVGSLFRQKQVDIIFLYISTYALSSTVLPVAQEAGVPVVVLNIQPVAAIDYEAFNALGDRGVMTGEWLAHCQACSVPEIANVFNRAGIDYHLLTGYLGDERTSAELESWVSAAMVAKTMRQNRLGVMGHYYGGMLDVYTDVTRQIARFGGHVELIEIDELAQLRAAVGDADIQQKTGEFHRSFAVSPECDEEEVIRAARTSVALDRLVEKHQLGSLAYYYEGSPGSEHEDIITSVIAGNTLLTGKHVPVAGECEIKNAQAMKILDSFGIGGSFSEFYAMDFNDDIVMLGHDGPAHFAIAEGEVGAGTSSGLSWETWSGPFHPNERKARPGNHPFGLRGEGRSVPPGRPGRKRSRSGTEYRKYQQPLPIPAFRKGIHRNLVQRRSFASLRHRFGASGRFPGKIRKTYQYARATGLLGGAMLRAGFAMKLLPGNVDEYKRRHDEIWPELVEELEKAGVRDYVIYLDPESLTLYASQKLTEHNRAEFLPETAVVKKWWAYMADLMETNEDNSPVVRDLTEMFYLD
jgi:L-arabinose isomerase